MNSISNSSAEYKTLSEIQSHLIFLYGEKEGRRTFQRLKDRIDQFTFSQPLFNQALDQRDAILITYGDQVRSTGEKPLQTLADFCQKWLSGVVTGIHILPFYPYSSDDGFSVIDYKKVDPELGSWDEIALISRSFRLMFDAVINHISAHSLWFQAFLQDDPRYKDYFIVIEGQPDLSTVVRPRTLALLTSFETSSGIKQLWTTFSEDQIDLDFCNPDVLLDILDVLMFYVSQGAGFFRLDAIAYLWKEIGTPCIHLPQTHRVVQLMRSVLNRIAPHVQLITETNVPHRENISYFGDGTNEAQLVYNFALPPILLYTFHTRDVRALTRWARDFSLPSHQVTYFNFLASHDGIGITPVRELISQSESEYLVERALAHGGKVSYKNNADGTRSPYELNINYFDALSDPMGQESVELIVDRFIAAHAIMFCLVGVPGIYFHSLFGSRGWPEGIQQTGRYRTINRQKLKRNELEQELNDAHSIRSQVFNRLSQLLRIRSANPAFNPFGSQRVIEFGNNIFALLRISTDAQQFILCLHNVSPEFVEGALKPSDVWPAPQRRVIDLISGEKLDFEPVILLSFRPYQVRWLAIAGPDE